MDFFEKFDLELSAKKDIEVKVAQFWKKNLII